MILSISLREKGMTGNYYKKKKRKGWKIWVHDKNSRNQQFWNISEDGSIKESEYTNLKQKQKDGLLTENETYILDKYFMS